MNYLTGKLAILTEEIFSVTRRGELVWQVSAGEGDFSAQIADLSVAVEKITGSDGMPAVAVLLRNRDGKLVQRFSDADLTDHDPENEEFRSFWELLGELYEMARWSAEGVFEIIDEMMGALVTDPEPESEADDQSDYGWAGNAVSRRLQTGSALDNPRRAVG